MNAKHIIEYETVLNDFSQSGNRYAVAPKLAWWARFCGIPLEDLLETIHNRGITNRDNDLTRLYNGAKIDTVVKQFTHYQKPKPPTVYPQYVKDLIAENATVVNAGDLMALSLYPVAHLHGINATKAMLQALFDGDEKIFIATMKQRETIREQNLRPLHDWLNANDLCDYEQVKINPFSGNYAEGGTKGQTLIGEKCISNHRYLLLEFDDIELLDQVKLVIGMINRGYEIATVTFSGNKSLHILLNIHTTNREKWNEQADKYQRLFVGADKQAIKPSIAIRLGGARRLSDIHVNEQRLLYLNPQYGYTFNGIIATPQKTPSSDVEIIEDNSTLTTAQTQPKANMTGYKYSCSDCQIKGECEYRFGAYWWERSARGKGCDCQRFSENGLDL